MVVSTVHRGLKRESYQDKIRALHKEIRRKNKQVSRLLETNLDIILEEVIVNVEFNDHRRDKVFGMIELYFDLLTIPVNGIWVWEGLRTHGLAYETRDEVGWGEHDYFIHLTEKGLSVRHKEGGTQNDG